MQSDHKGGNARERYLGSRYYRDSLLPFLRWILDRHHQCGGVTEIRILGGGRRGVWSGYFDKDHCHDLVEAVLPVVQVRKKIPYDDYPRIGEANTYFTLQAVHPDLLGRAANRIKRADTTTSDGDIVAYCLFAVDIDAVRKAGISATDEEKAHAREVAMRVIAWFAERHIRCILADSGNGYHLLIPTTPYTGEGVAEASRKARVLLKVLDSKFSTDHAKIDTDVFNPARIFKLYGSLAMKGDPIEDRPHRWASINMSDVPADVDVFAILSGQIEQFEEESSVKPADPPAGQTARTSGACGWDADTSKRVLEDVLSREGLVYRRTEKDGWTYFHFETCPFHTDDDGHQYECCVLVEADGKYGASCKHDADAGWQNFKAVIGWDRHVGEVKMTMGLTTEFKGERSALGGNVPTNETPWEPPAPLGEFDLPPFPLEAFPRELSVLCEFCAAAAESYQVPVDLVAMQVMATGGAALAKTIEVHVRGDHIEPVNLFTATAMPPGSRKSAIFRIATQPLADFERQEIERLRPAIERSRNERVILEESLTHAQKQAAKARDAKERADYQRQAREYAEQLSQHEDLKVPQYIGDDATPESVVKLLYDNGGRFALMSPEGDVFDLMAGRYSSTGTPNLGVYLKGHAGDDIRVNRVNRDRQVQYVRKPALTIGLAVQPDVIRGLAGQKGFRGRGLLGRFLYSLPESGLGHRKTITRPVEKTILAAYSQLILNAVQLKSVLDRAGWPTPLSVTINDAGLAALNDFAVDVEKNLRAGGEFESMGDWAGKLVGAVCRIAGIMHGLTHVGPQGLQNLQIDQETILGAIAIGEYLVPHAKAAFFEMGADPSIDIARKILRWVEDERLLTFSKRDAFNQCRGTVHKVTEMDEPLRLLSGHGYIREQQTQRDGPGRKPSQNYDVNPLWLAQNTHNSHNAPLVTNSAHCAECAEEVRV
ncbi:MAG: YfjI family protein [Phycisphaerae bacterium]|nr:YfjI family protein [Phycisphaerae bacterium]